MKILLVDDQPLNVYLLEVLLQRPWVRGDLGYQRCRGPGESLTGPL